MPERSAKDTSFVVLRLSADLVGVANKDVVNDSAYVAVAAILKSKNCVYSRES